MVLKRGQLGIEFFLILSVSIAFAIVIYNTIGSETAKSKAMNDVLTAKASLDSLASGVDFVLLNGPGSQVKRSVLIPQSGVCFYYEAVEKKFYCVIYNDYLNGLEKKLVYSSELMRDISGFRDCAPKPLGNTWYIITIENNGGTVELSCNA